MGAAGQFRLNRNVPCQGIKGGKGRYSILSPTLLQVLRQYARTFHPKTWLFAESTGKRPMFAEMAQRAYRAAGAQAGITKTGGIHTLRHCFATHLLEGGVYVSQIGLQPS
jgi:site-specific recombinase XerD